MNQNKYIGKELDLFKIAKHWKVYYSSKIKQFISGDVLEVGAGIGVNTGYMFNEKVKSWTFLEPDSELANKIPNNTSKIKTSKKILIETIESLRGKKFDTIIYIDVLEHIQDSQKEIARAKKCLNNNGYLIILVPAYQSLFNEFDHAIGHFRRYNKRLMNSDINDELRKVKLYYLDSLGLIASVVNKFFLNQKYPTLKQIQMWDNFIIPLSIVFDLFSLYSFGKSLIGIYKNQSMTQYSRTEKKEGLK